jgi:polar amino acid transport system substrate-binding protein
MGVDASTPPFAAGGTDASEVVGFDIDLMNAIGVRSGFEVEYVRMEYNNMLKLVRECRLDGAISAIEIKDDLKQQMWLSQPYSTTRHVIVVKQGNIVINGRESLNGMIVGSQGGTLSELEMRKTPGVTPKMYASNYAAFQDLINGLIDAVIADYPRAMSYVAVKRNQLKVVGEPFGEIHYGIAVCTDRKDLAKKIEDHLQAIQADGLVQKLAKKWKVIDR